MANKSDRFQLNTYNLMLSVKENRFSAASLYPIPYTLFPIPGLQRYSLSSNEFGQGK
ncbi:hypothetical protein [Moorena producens]|uniref:hypothetical protein n=1 Tax=Moorena producens TaxID=1155739 RepID=UPI001314FB2C|nr:hypothetical protein [Moorena producens]